MDFLRSVTRRFFPQFLTKRGPKRAVPSVLTTKSSSEFVRFRQIKSKRFGQEKTPEMAYFQGFSHLTWSRLTLRELRSTTCGFEAVLLKVSGSKILYLSRFLRVMPLGCPLGCPREAPVLVWCLFPLGFYNIAQDDCFFKRQEEEPILFGSSTGYSAFAYMLLKALFTMVDSASGLLYFTLAYMSIVILLFS